MTLPGIEDPSPKPRVERVAFTLRQEEIAAAFNAPPEAANELGDARVASRWSEYWAAVAFDFTKSENSNEKGYDLYREVDGRRETAGVRGLTKNIDLKSSQYQGKGRSGGIQALKDSLNQADYQIIVDLGELPKVSMYLIHRDDLLREVEAGRIPRSKWARSSVLKFLESTQIVDRQADWSEIPDLLLVRRCQDTTEERANRAAAIISDLIDRNLVTREELISGLLDRGLVTPNDLTTET